MLFPKKCPLCSTKMSTVNGVLTCPICGYNESFHSSSYSTSNSGKITKNIDTNRSAGTDTSQNSRSYYQTSGGTSDGTYGQNDNTDSQQSNLRPYQQYLNQSQANNSASGQSFSEITAQRRAVYGDERRKANNSALIICIALFVFFAAIFFPIVIRFFAYGKNSASSAYGGRGATGSYSDAANDALSDYYLNKYNNLNKYNYDTTEDSAPTITVPETLFFSQVVCLIFNKEIDDISAKDTEQIISLHVYEVNYDYKAVDYTLADGTSGTVYPVSQSPDVSKDLTCFVNLEELYLEYSYATLNLKGLDKLHTLYVDEDIDDITKTITPSQITSLGLYDAKFSLSGLSEFTNVESLYLDCTLLSDIDEIANLPKLKSLAIVDGDYIDDLSALYNMTQLEALSIESNTLRDVTFLTKFDHLTELTIIGSKVLDFNPLAECTGLKKLYLLKNYETRDYEFLKNMTELTELGLITSFNFDDSDMPDFSALNKVTKLHLGNFESFDNLKYMTNVEELIIDDGGYGDFGSNNALLSLPNLRSLTLMNSSVSPEMLKQVSEVEGLEKLDFYYSYLWGSINPILSMPNLRELNLQSASFMLDTDSLSQNENLRFLNLNKATISKYNAIQWADRENLDPEKLQEALTNFHGMETLMLEEQKLNSVEFAKEMEQLKLLNITNNYVISLSPLENLQNLQAIVCETNPISDTAGLDELLVK